MSFLHTSPETAAYLDRLAPLLAHLPDDECADLLEELAIHLDSVLEVADAAGDGRDLQAIVGEPTQFVRDFCESAGLSLAPVDDAPTPETGPVSSSIRRIGRTVSWFETKILGRDSLRSAIGFLPELRPAWWVLRGVLLVMIAGQIFGFDGVDRWGFLPMPKLFGSVALGLVASVWSVRKSVEMGRRRTHAERRNLFNRGRLLNIGIGVVGLIILGTGMAAAGLAFANTGYYEEPIGGSIYTEAVPVTEEGLYFEDGPGSQGHVHLEAADGTDITNIYPFDDEGRPLSGVRLFDQLGRPIDNLSREGFAIDGEDISWTPEFSTDATGQLLRHRFPRVNHDDEGRYQESPWFTHIALPVPIVPAETRPGDSPPAEPAPIAPVEAPPLPIAPPGETPPTEPSPFAPVEAPPLPIAPPGETPPTEPSPFAPAEAPPLPIAPDPDNSTTGD